MSLDQWTTKLSDLKAGDILIVDAGFGCLAAGEHVVKSYENKHLYIVCDQTYHFLDGGVTINGCLIGMHKKEPA